MAPVVATNDPAGACRHDVCPASGWYDPAAQSVGDVAPLVGTKEPGGAETHVLVEELK